MICIAIHKYVEQRASALVQIFGFSWKTAYPTDKVFWGGFLPQLQLAAPDSGLHHWLGLGPHPALPRQQGGHHPPYAVQCTHLSLGVSGAGNWSGLLSSSLWPGGR